MLSQPTGTRAMICCGLINTTAMTAIAMAAIIFNTNWIRSFITTEYIPPTTQ